MGQETLKQSLIRVFAKSILPGESDHHDPERLEAIASLALEAMSQRQPAVPSIVAADAGARNGKRLSHIAICNDDMAFLVDSVAAIVADHGLTIRTLLHPVVSVARNADGALSAIDTEKNSAQASQEKLRESIIYIEMDRTDAHTRAQLVSQIESVLSDVRAAVDDWKPMLSRLEMLAARTALADAAPFLHWLADGHFTFLGHATAMRKDMPASDGLGLLRSGEIAQLVEDSRAGERALNSLRESGKSILIAKADRISTVHRPVPLDVIILPLRDDNGTLTGISCFIGLFTSKALSTPVDQIPFVSERLSALVAHLGLAAGSHTEKALIHAAQQLPRDLLLSMDDAELGNIVLTAMSLIDRPRPAVRQLRDPLGRYATVFVWLPRDEFSSQRRMDIGSIITRISAGVISRWHARLDDDLIVTVRYIVRDAANDIDTVRIEELVEEMLGGWVVAVEQALQEKLGSIDAARLATLYDGALPQNYLSRFGPADIAADIERLSALPSAEARSVRFYRTETEKDGQIRLKIYRTAPVAALSEIVPVLENFGFELVDVYPYQIGGQKPGWIHDFLLSNQTFTPSLEHTPAIEEAISHTLEGKSENDSFNALITGAGLDAFSVSLFRAWFRYLRQAGHSFGQATIANALLAHKEAAHALVRLFAARHDPSLTADTRPAAIDTANHLIETALQAVQAIDHDAILRAFRSLIDATLRSNAFVPGGPEALAFKLDSHAIPGLPKPVPWREIFVSSPRVEGVHLRGGPVARGGIRWSDRRDDYRTEVLGLIKAQIVKNAVIVPTGAKGGFYAKQLPSPDDRDAWLDEGREAYRIFIRALLSLTDNLISGEVVPPAHVVTLHDADDPYLVVAADKGTASFSDTANAIAQDQNFWLGDAFASGGSNGYDHKAMGITARGAWISVQRHFAELGLDVQTDSITVAGVGDMSGDVFGNGMLRSSAIRLVAAFDHRHIFIDPTPVPEAAWRERKRLFALPRSTWADYDASLISTGGGVWPRTQKEIPLSPEMQSLLATDQASLSPTELITAILTAPVDLLWFGGIGTYIKGRHETHAMVGDRANDAVRVNGEDVQARVTGEGANLGVTQAGRIEYAARGGRINADFIDNSAGVDCSDNEVNIKIALNAEVRENRLSMADRNALLHDMTDDVAELVLEDNRQQTLALSLAEKTAIEAIGDHQRIIQILEAGGRLDRFVEGLPDDEQFALRKRDGRGLERPELAIVMAYAKMALQDAITAAKPEIGQLHRDTLLKAFPPQMVDRFQLAIEEHRLRVDIVATKTANRMINHIGFARPFTIADEEGVDIAEVAGAYVATEALFDLPALWPAIEAASSDGQMILALMDTAAEAIAFHLADIVRLCPPATDPDVLAERLRPSLSRLIRETDVWAAASVADEMTRLQTVEGLTNAPLVLLEKLARLHALDGVAGIADLAVRLNLNGQEVELAEAYNMLGRRLGLDWAKASALALPAANHWGRLLIAGVARDLEQSRIDLLSRICLDHQNPIDAAQQWLESTPPPLTRFDSLIENARNQPEITAAMLAHIARQARLLLDWEAGQQQAC